MKGRRTKVDKLRRSKGATDHRLAAAVILSLLVFPSTLASADEPLIVSISKETLWRNRDGQSRTWFHPRACMMPGPDGQPVALMTLQEIGGSDYFGQVHRSLSADLGKTWSEPEPIAALGRDPVTGRGDGLKAGVCDVTPQYHPQSGTVIALGHVVFYKGAYFARKEHLPRYPVYVTRGKDGTWSKRKILEWNDPRGGHIYSNNCGQRVVLPGGDVQMSFTFGPQAEHRMVAGVRAAFDGDLLTVREVGPSLHNPKGRGLLEPSVTRFGGKFWITMRAEDNRGYVSTSDDGLHGAEKQAWAWEDGTPLDMSTTQQHWLTHSDGLFLVYTRKDASNINVIRWRSPLWVAQVDVDRQCLIKSTEQVVLPLVGEGVNDPDKVALMGNFQVVNASERESWVTVGEWMPRNGYRGDVLLARIRWSRPNHLASVLDQDKEVWTSLFNGKDLTGWHQQKERGQHGSGGHWGVTTDGVLFGEQGPPGSGNGGLLLTDETYSEFELELSLRPDWGPDSGVFVRTDERGGGWQIYVDHHDHGNVGHIRLETKPYSLPFRPWGFSRIDPAKPDLEMDVDARTTNWPAGVYEESCTQEQWLHVWKTNDWNRLRVRCTGGELPVIETWVNGLKVCRFNAATTTHPKFDRDRAMSVIRPTGSIGLQVHGGKNWQAGDRVFWKDIRIRKIAR